MHKVSKGGSYRIDRTIDGLGRFAMASGAKTRAGFRDRNSMVTGFVQQGRLDVLRAVQSRKVSLSVLYAAWRKGDDAIKALMASLEARPEQAEEMLLRAAVDAWLPSERIADPTKRRYRVSLDKLVRLHPTIGDLTLAELPAVKWKTMGAAWPGSGTDWNHLGRALSMLLSESFGDQYHETARAFRKAFPKQAERQRVPDLDPETFFQVVAHAPEYIRAAYVCIVILGLRTGEYLRLQAEHLHPITKSVAIPGTKTKGSAATLKVDPELWGWVTAAVPAPVQYKWLRLHWKRALKAAGADQGLRLHDLRHLAPQWLTDAGQSEARVQSFMRHATAGMTRRYATQKDHGENARKLADIFRGVA